MDTKSQGQKREMPKKKNISLTERRMQLENEKALQHAKIYFAEHHDLDVPGSYVCKDGFTLGKWLIAARVRYKNGTLPSDVIEQLNELHFAWNAARKGGKRLQLADYQIGIHHAENYFAEHQNLDARATYVCDDGFKLGQWLSYMRVRYKKNILPEEIIQQLNALHIEWKPIRKSTGPQRKFENYVEGIRHAEEFYASHRHLNVPKKYVCEDGFLLGDWIIRMRRLYRQNHLMPEVFERLQAIDFVWNPKEHNWSQYCEACKAFLQEHPGEPLPTTVSDRFRRSLNSWFQENNRKFQAGELSKERAALRPDLRTQRARERWNANFEDVAAYLAEHPDCTFTDIPDELCGRNNTNLSKWLKAQDEKYHSADSNLSSEQRKKLEQIGIVKWPATRQDRSWVSYCLELKAFYEKHGNLYLPEMHQTLQDWFLMQRGLFRENGLSEEKMRYLEENGLINLFRADIRNDNGTVRVEMSREEYDLLSQLMEDSGCKTVGEYLRKLSRG